MPSINSRSASPCSPLVGTACIELGYKHIVTTSTCERGAAKGGSGIKTARHNGRAVGKNRNVSSNVHVCSTRLCCPFVGAACIELGYKHIETTGTCELNVPEGSGFFEISRHNGGAVGKDGDAISVFTILPASPRGPLVDTVRVELGYKDIFTTSTCERGVAEGCVAAKSSYHNGRAVGKNRNAL